ncbi:MAG TPA: glycosyl hydrolase family 28-related protein, partial [Novosphingobium sp.]|nr:glycosyl hydrolase family 28-related protein [Novosphingobium sp.]
MAIELIGLTIARSLAANSGAAGVYAPNQIYASTAVGRKLQEVTSVRDYGALGDGVTDDTAAIQNAINTLIAGNNGGQLYFPPGTYVISAALTISFATHWRIYGASRGKVTIRQTADNTPIFTLTTALTWGWKIEELTFTWANAQPATNTGAIAIYMSGAASYSGGFYNFQISRCNFSNGYRAISGPSTLQCPLWGVEIYGCCHLGTMTGAFFYAAPSPSVGQPNIHLRNCFIDAGLASEALVTIVAGDTISLSNLEFVNGAASRCGSLMMLSTCMSLTVNSCKSEAFVFDTGSTPYLWNFPNSRVTLINCSIIGFTGTGNPRLIAAGSGGTLSISGIILSSSLTSGNAVAWLAT